MTVLGDGEDMGGADNEWRKLSLRRASRQSHRHHERQTGGSVIEIGARLIPVALAPWKASRGRSWLS